ncbi:spore germination protein [Cohnella sp. REN36]|uniref:spore germination protein n=1 Tax=Cohnella sp. REN36 TaxID=2887347 RepID=UPI001D1433C6|nr:spore germination protein [Cohnella sp. REN36]MCC3371535.1 spore germination protein [Cohnella sp. REN36]
MATRGWEQLLVEKFQGNADFAIKQAVIAGRAVAVYMFESIVDLPATLERMDQSLVGLRPDIRALEQLADLYRLRADPTLTELAHLLLQGKLVIRHPESGEPMVFKAEPPAITRPVSSAENENRIQGANDAFTEELQINIGLLRKNLKRQDLMIVKYSLGSTSCREVALVYLRSETNPEIVRAVDDRLKQNKRRDIRQVDDLLGLLGHPRFALVATYVSTELPEEAAQNLLDGKAVLLLDQFPNALAVPAIVRDVWSIKTDHNYPQTYLAFFRFIRLIGIVFAIVMPGLYVVLNSVNPELLRIQLALSVAKSREGVPYPAFIEVLLMLLVLEMVIEATTRLPKSIGPTITMIGGIILGQAIVQAKLVSNLLIIILAASTIANFTVAGYLNTIGIRIFKYVVLFVSAAFGILGLEVAVIWMFLYFAGLKTLTVPYLSLSVKGSKADE